MTPFPLPDNSAWIAALTSFGGAGLCLSQREEILAENVSLLDARVDKRCPGNKFGLMTRYPRKLKRIKRVQMVERPVPGYQWVHPQVHPELFGPAKAQARRKLAHDLKGSVKGSGWVKIRYRDTQEILIVYGQCFRDPDVLHGALNGHYDLYLQPPNLGDKTT